jgi:hypothetical protein
MVALHFGEVKQKATTVFEEICSDKVVIKKRRKSQGPKGHSATSESTVIIRHAP